MCILGVLIFKKAKVIVLLTLKLCRSIISRTVIILPAYTGVLYSNSTHTATCK